MAIASHIRATFADPGEIPKDIEVPDFVDTVKLRNCEKCDMRWKPMRAHHCSECNKCIFKVSTFLFQIFHHLFLSSDGPSLPMDQ